MSTQTNFFKMKAEDKDLDRLMRSSYQSLVADEEQSLISFIVFNSDDEVIQIDVTKDKIVYLNGIIKYFEGIEEFEKCEDLLRLKKTILKE